MRGKEDINYRKDEMLRITPAHAGKRRFPMRTISPSEDHPRTCGEKKVFQINKRQSEGSPPHMRGKEAMNITEIATARITPAHAGKRGLVDF